MHLPDASPYGIVETFPIITRFALAYILWRRALAGCILVLLGLLLHYHWRIVTAPVPLDLFEGVMPWITGLIAEGRNPYTRELQPQALDVYPPLYNILVAPLSLIFGNSLELHRAVSALFIAYSCILCGLVGYRHGGSKVYALTAVGLLYAALLFYITPVASTNAPGVALFLTATLAPWWFGFSNRGLIVSLLCSVLVFYTKQYFILGMAIVCLYTFLYVSMSRALILGCTFALALTFSLTLVHFGSPYYLDNTLFAPQSAISQLYMIDIVVLQITEFAIVYSGILLVLFACFVRRRWALLASNRRWSTVAGSGLAAPLLKQPLDYFWFCLFWASIAVVLSIGGNPGNYMTYLFQLMSPFLLIGSCRLFADLQGRLRWLAPLLLFSLYKAYTILPRDFSVDLEKWEEMHALIEENDDILATPMLLMSLLERGKTIHQDGHTFYFPLAENKPALFVKSRPEDRVGAIWREYIDGIYRNIESGKFDLILFFPWEIEGIFGRNPPPRSELSGAEFLRKFYFKERTIPLSMTDRHGGGTRQVQVWRPRTSS